MKKKSEALALREDSTSTIGCAYIEGNMGLRSHAILKSIAWVAVPFSLSQVFHFLLFEGF